TLVRTSGSTYRRAGARLLVMAGGSLVGLISGGCLEPQIAEAAREVLDTGLPRRLRFDMTGEHDGLVGFGLGCRGTLDILLEKLEPWRLGAEARRLLCGMNTGAAPRALVTAFDAPPALSHLLGSFLLEEGGAASLSSAHGALHEAVSALAREALVTERTLVRTVRLPEGLVECFVDLVPPAFHLTVFGAGPDAVPLVAMARQLDWRVTVIDHRPALCDAARFPGAERVVHAHPESAAAHVPVGRHSAVVVMTHNYFVDLRLLPVLLGLDVSYVGLLGPRSRGEQLLGELAGEFVPTAEQRARLYSPVGLRLGGDTPATIALSIAAEVQAVLSQGEGVHLRQHDGPIHLPEAECRKSA
ncbi:MAG TPA: XdhC family protein, partial [Myxococcaceae bacterium]|nr:XdhC family protein [Myxococcaceae bacterium]